MYVYTSLSLLEEHFNYLESTNSFEGISTVNLHHTSQKQSTGKDIIFWWRKQNQIKNELLISSQIAKELFSRSKIVFLLEHSHPVNYRMYKFWKKSVIGKTLASTVNIYISIYIVGSCLFDIKKGLGFSVWFYHSKKANALDHCNDSRF